MPCSRPPSAASFAPGPGAPVPSQGAHSAASFPPNEGLAARCAAVRGTRSAGRTPAKLPRRQGLGSSNLPRSANESLSLATVHSNHQKAPPSGLICISVVAEKIIFGQVTGNYRPKSLLANLARPFGICGNPKERSGSTGSASSSSFRSLVAFPLTRRRLNIPLCASLLWARKLRGRCAHAASKHTNHCCGEWRYPFRFSDTHEFSSQVLRQRDQLVNSSSDLATVEVGITLSALSR